MPQSPHIHAVGGAARKNENPKAEEHPVKWKISAFADEVAEREGYREIRQRYQ
jgi:hypothetical protein